MKIHSLLFATVVHSLLAVACSSPNTSDSGPGMTDALDATTGDLGGTPGATDVLQFDGSMLDVRGDLDGGMGLDADPRDVQLLTPDTFVASLTPRPIAPMSLGDVTLRRPTLRWQLPSGMDTVVVELCRDRACTMPIESLRVTGTSVRPTLPLPARSVVYWRLRGALVMAPGMGYGPTWLFHVPAMDNSGAIDTSYNAHVDLNGDGFDDVVVGAPLADPGGRLSAGTASVYHGAMSGIPTNPIVVLEGETAGDRFGGVVASAGDVNGDGFGDLLVASAGADPAGRVNAGSVSVFLGSSGGVSTRERRVLSGVVAGDQFGFACANAGDLNADGYSDLLIGANTADPGGRADAGTASVFLGVSTGVSMAPARVLEGANAGDWYFMSVASAGDLNGDGFSDLVIGAPTATAGGRLQAGSASVWHGSVNGISAAPTRVLDGLAADDNFGNAVASAGDTNADGYGDLVVGAYLADPMGQASAGTATVYLGGPMGLLMAGARVLNGGNSINRFGISVARAGDVNGDGMGDLVVGSFIVDAVGAPDDGRVILFHGTPSGISYFAARQLDAAPHNDWLVLTVSGAGDVNGDGYADILVGGSRSDPGGRIDAGSTRIFQGSVLGIPLAPTSVLEGENANDQFGTSVAGLWRQALCSRSRG